ncbi:pyridoxal phosphate-dependent decarboxylase family protein [Actinomadura coerulea]|uniref:pyridoxal phosphate-dependent decarboxylase family protein n=1 Tax=Actinomadura coerulea TaxID=46159 RepID=UPI00341E9EC5
MADVSEECPPSVSRWTAPESSLLGAFDPVLFRRNSEAVAARLESHLADRSVRGLDLADPGVLAQAARALMTTERESIAAFDEKRLAAIVDLYVRTGIQVHSPGYMGRQFSGTVPLAGVIDFVGSVVSQPSSYYEAGQLPITAERIMAEELNRFIGWDPGRFAMVTTSGGSLANLTALLAARNRAYPDIWACGEHGGRGLPAIAVSEEVHYSVTRAAGVLGIGEKRIVRLPVDPDGRIAVHRVPAVLAAAERRGLEVFCLVASAGTTALGAFDPIDELAGIAAEGGIWLHVDGAHGASLLVSDVLRHKLRGIEKADSLTWDAHKLMFVPAPCTMLFYRDARDAPEAFGRGAASYVLDEEPDAHCALDSGDKNLECTKRPMIMPLWALWAVYGRALFAQKIEQLCQTAHEAHRILLDEPDFEVLHEPEANILCFRYRPEGIAAERVHRLQLRIRKQVRLAGRFFISKVDVQGTAALRVVFMNHQINAEHFRMLLAEIRSTGQRLLRGDLPA